ncbi:hypothetical protein ACFTZB_05575 [Rhodococcus sp. NPDC057014]|uniref:hypothetical protein n=1 Tax=Rhodococcus sp. NPDC057014 TaxID=3346000 RepID=UPI00363DAC07
MTKPQNGSIDEVVFDATFRALQDAGVSRAEVDLSVVASIDLFDGTAMSNSVTTPSAAGWMTNEYRLEDDAGVALVSAGAAIAAGDAEIAIVVGLHYPASGASFALAEQEFAERVAALSLEPLYERPVGLTATTSLALHAARQLALGETTIEEMATIAANEISRGSGRPRSGRRTVATAEQVLASPQVSSPITELMLPAPVSGAIALVLASPARAQLCPRPRAAIRGHGISNGGNGAVNEWVTDPQASTRRAAAAAYRRADVDFPNREFDVVEFTAPTPALVDPLCEALGIDWAPNDARLNPSGGARSAYAGAANGALRVLEAVDWLDNHGRRGSRALVHSVDNLTGPIGATSTVHVLERVS